MCWVRRVVLLFFLVKLILSQRTLILDLDLEAEAELGQKFCLDNSSLKIVKDEFFRVESDSKNCRDVISCTSSSSVVALRCPSGLSFDIEKQVCDWSDLVKNCHQKLKSVKEIPKYDNSNNKCPNLGDFLCADDVTCLPKEKFCDEISDCPNSSDENLCGLNQDPNRGPDCLSITPNKCKLPDCFCTLEASVIPGGLEREETPQMIVISFEDSLNEEHDEIIRQVFGMGRSNYDEPTFLNPNNCSIKGTFFVSHEYTDYSYVHKLSEYGHEIAVHSISNNYSKNYWTHLNESSWTKEIGKMKHFLEIFANLPASDKVQGSRVPLLRVGGNPYFMSLTKSKFKYDSSIVVPSSYAIPFWPYTLDAQLSHECYGDGIKCPTRPFKGLWEIPVNELKTPNDKFNCIFFELCPNMESPHILFRSLHHNFLRHFRTNRAPFAINLNPSWFKSRPELLDGLVSWIRRIQRKFRKIVYFVSNEQVLDWMRNPTPLSKLKDFQPWKRNCRNDFHRSLTSSCIKKTCDLNHGSGSRTFHFCLKTCPDKYPWL